MPDDVNTDLSTGSMEMTFHDVDFDAFKGMFITPQEEAANASAWIWGQLSRCTYKPGWDWYVGIDHVFRKPYVTVVFDAPDARGGGKTVQVGSKGFLPDHVIKDRSEDGFMFWLDTFLMQAERHEQMEWLRRDGEIWNDPHVPFRFRESVKEPSDQP